MFQTTIATNNTIRDMYIHKPQFRIWDVHSFKKNCEAYLYSSFAIVSVCY